MFVRDCLSALLLTAVLGGCVLTEAAQASMSHLAGVSNLCRCEAEWESFYDRRQRQRGLQTTDEAGFYIVDGIKVIPCDRGASEFFVADPASIKLAANIFHDSDAGRHLINKKTKSGSSKRKMSKTSKSRNSKSTISKKYVDEMDVVDEGSKSSKNGKDKSASGKSSRKVNSSKEEGPISSNSDKWSGKKISEGKLPPVFDCSVDFPSDLTDEPGSKEYIRGPVRDHYIAYAVPQLKAKPTQAETTELLELTKLFWTSYFETYYADKDILFEGLELAIDEKLNNAGKPEPQFNYYLDFDAVILYDLNSAEPPNATETFAIMTQADFADYILSYVRAIPAFASTNQVSFRAISSRESATTLATENTPSPKENVEVDTKEPLSGSDRGKMVPIAFLSAVAGAASLLL